MTSPSPASWLTRLTAVAVSVVLVAGLVTAAYDLGARAVPPPVAAELPPGFELIGEVYDRIQAGAVEVPDDRELLEGAVDGMLEALEDPYAVFYDPAVFADVREALIEGRFTGVGMVLEEAPDGLTVLGTLPDTPAERAGVEPGERLVSVDGRDVRASPIEAVVELVRGEEGTTVVLGFDGGRAGARELEMVREEIDLPLVDARMLDDGAGYVRVTQFAGGAARQLRSAVASLVEEGANGIVRLLKAPELNEVRTLVKLPSLIESVAELPGMRVAIATTSGEASIFNFHNENVSPLCQDQPGGVRGLELSPDRTQLATYNAQGVIWVRDSNDLAVTHRFAFPSAVHQVRFSQDGRLLGAAGESGRLLIWDLHTNEVLHDMSATGGVNTVRSLAFSNDGRLVAAGLIHRGIVVFDVTDGRNIGELNGHSEAVSGLMFRPDDEVIVSTSWDRTIRTWKTSDLDVDSGTSILGDHEHYVLAAQFSPDGSLLASASLDGSVVLWDPDLAASVARFAAHRTLRRAFPHPPR
jgi:hypothetical protein